MNDLRATHWTFVMPEGSVVTGHWDHDSNWWMLLDAEGSCWNQGRATDRDQALAAMIESTGDTSPEVSP